MNYYNEIKNKLIDNEINRRVKNYSINKSDLDTYYYVGKMLSEAGKHYGEGIIKNYSIKLILEVDKKYNPTTLKRIRQFYLMIEKGATLWHQLTWSHYKLIIALNTIEEINYYSQIAVSHMCSVRQLESIIKSNEYNRLPIDTREKLINKEEPELVDFVKNPIVIKNNTYETVSEAALQKLILEDIPHFLKELGSGFTFVDNEYKIKIGNNYNYIDLLLFNYEFNCFVVIELKVTELKKEHIGQIQVYMNYIDKNLRKFNQDKTIGIILCRKNNKFIMEYKSDPRIISREFELTLVN